MITPEKDDYFSKLNFSQRYLAPENKNTKT